VSSVGVFLTGISIGFFGIVNTLFASGGFAFLTAVVYLVGLRE